MLFLVGLAGQALYCFMRPAAPFDSIVYVSLLDDGSQQAYREAARTCAATLPGPRNQCDVSGSSYRVISAYSPSEYQTFLRFYRVKPLYTGMARLLHRVLHLPGFAALRVLSALSFVVVGLTIASWLRRNLSIPAACISALLLVSFPQVIAIGKYLLPDMFSVALMLLCLYSILYLTRRLWVQMLLLAVLPLARPDNVILSLLLGALLLYRATTDYRRLLLRLTMLFLGGALLNAILSKATNALSYTILFNHSFLNFSQPSQYSAMRLSFHDYVQVLLAEAPRVVALFFPVPLFFSFLVLSDETTSRPLRDVVLAATASAFARLALFPAEEERYYTWWLIIAATAAAATLGERFILWPYWFGVSSADREKP